MKKKRRHSKLEQQIWAVAFSNAYVKNFFTCKQIRWENGDKSPFDTAAEMTTGETPWTVADLAVEAYRTWYKDEVFVRKIRTKTKKKNRKVLSP